MKITVSVQQDIETSSVICTSNHVSKIFLRVYKQILNKEKLITKKAKLNFPIIAKAKTLVVDLQITNNKRVRALNKKYRNLDKTTDVLSFGLIDSGLIAHETLLLGDVIISLPMIEKQAKRFKVSIQQEFERMLTHGFLHLLGFDHVGVRGIVRNEMRAIEDNCMKKVKIQTTKNYLALFEKDLKSIQPKYSKDIAEKYIGGGQSKHTYLGLTVPQMNAVLEKYLSEVIDDRTLFAIFKKTHIYEVKNIVLYYLNRNKENYSASELFKLLVPFVEHIDNWALSDGLSAMYARCLEQEPKVAYSQLQRWGKSENAWQIRQSMVSLLYYARERKRILPFKKCIVLVKPHLESHHLYVQKAVGWTLRELRNVYTKETEAFLEEYINKIRGYAFSAATEKMTKSRKEYFKRLKKSQ